MPGPMLRRDLEAKAESLRQRLHAEEMQKQDLRQQARSKLDLADTILQSVEQSLQNDNGGALTARSGRARALPPIMQVRPDTAEQ